MKIPVSIPDLKGNEAKYLLECIETGYVSTVGSKVQLFEEKLSNFLNIKKDSICALSSGTESLTVGIRAIGIKKDEHIIMPSFTFIATANSIYNAGCLPIILDVSEKDSYTLSAEDLHAFLIEETYQKQGSTYYKKTNKKISAVVSVSVLGNHPNVEEIKPISREYNLLTILDAAGAFGSVYGQNTLMEHIDFGIYSFNGNKLITTGAGGAFFSDNIDLTKKVRHIASTARIGPNYTHDYIGFNARMTNVHAAIGIAQLERADEFLRRRREIFQLYKNFFSKTTGIQTLQEPTWCKSNNWLSGFIVKNGKLDVVINNLNLHGILCSRFWKPVDQQIAYKEYKVNDCSVANELYETLLVLPSSPSIKDDDIEYIANIVKGVLQ